MTLLGRVVRLIVLGIMLAGCATGPLNYDYIPTPVTSTHIEDINRQLRAAGISRSFVALDWQGRIELQGEYDDEAAVDQAFSIAQTVVGVRWVSPVTPERIRVAEWSLCLSNLLSGKACGPPRLASLPSVVAAPGPLMKRYALIVGIGRFRNVPGGTLKYASKDAEDLYRYLIDPHGGNFPEENVILLQNEAATRGAIEAALAEMKARLSEDDLFVLYFSSHGTPPDKFGGVHIVTYDTEVKPRERVWRTALTEGVLGAFIQETKAKRLVVVMDACYSNGAYAKIPGFLPTGGKSLGLEGEEGYGRSRVGMVQRLLGAKDLILVDDNPPSDLGSTASAWGKVLISASDAGEKSWESDRIRNSFFTHYFIEGLRRGDGRLKEAFEYAKPLVTTGVREEKEAEQHPQLTPSRRDWHMSLAGL
ncbi:MAG: caspase family protein [Gammaproteobacteria bacterium]